MPNIGHVTFTNYEAVPIAHETHDVFVDCAWFHVNGDKPFMAYGNGKSAVQVSPGVAPDGVHYFKGYKGNAITLPAATSDPIEHADGKGGDARQPYPVLLHYPYPCFSVWAAKFELYGSFSNYWLDDERYPNKLDFMLQSRDIVQNALKSGDWTEARQFFHAKVLSWDEIQRGVKNETIRSYVPFRKRSTYTDLE